MFTIGKDTFPERPRLKRIPFGYQKSPDDPSLLIPDKEICTLLSESFDSLEKGFSLRAVADDLNLKIIRLRPGDTQDASDVISHAGLDKLFAQYRPEAKRKKREKILAQRKPKTPPKRRILRKTAKIAADKKRIIAAQKRIAKLSGERQVEQDNLDRADSAKKTSVLEIDYVDYIEPELEPEVTIGYRPNHGPQTEFLSSSEFQVLYGGAAGGGKTMALIMDPTRYFGNPNFFGLILRRTTDELREIKMQTHQVYTTLFPKGHKNEAQWRENDSEWRFKNGGRLWLTYLDRDLDVVRFQGQSFTWVAFDELTHWPTSYPWDYLSSRVRTTDPSLKGALGMRATTNPGGVGHLWVKRMFVDPAPPGKAFWATNIETGNTLLDDDPGSKTFNKPLFRRKFIPARLDDNPYLAEDGMYRRSLLAQNEKRRDQLLYGDWNVSDGAAFPEFRTKDHVWSEADYLKPYDVVSIPRTWTRFRSMDWGQQSKHCILWFAINPDTNQLIVYRELYKGGLTAQEVAETVKYIERSAGERISYGMLDSSVWHKRGEGPSPAEIMIGYGVPWRPSDRSQGSRIAGKNMIHQLLRINPETGQPGLIFLDNCRNIISELQVAPADPHGGDDIDEKYRQQYHAYDTLRYGVSSRPQFVDPFLLSKSHHYRPVDRIFGA